jgi:hypothetical protein
VAAPGIAFGVGFDIGFFSGFGWGWHHWGCDWGRRAVVRDHDVWCRTVERSSIAARSSAVDRGRFAAVPGRGDFRGGGGFRGGGDARRSGSGDFRGGGMRGGRGAQEAASAAVNRMRSRHHATSRERGWGAFSGFDTAVPPGSVERGSSASAGFTAEFDGSRGEGFHDGGSFHGGGFGGFHRGGGGHR